MAGLITIEGVSYIIPHITHVGGISEFPDSGRVGFPIHLRGKDAQWVLTEENKKGQLNTLRDELLLAIENFYNRQR